MGHSKENSLYTILKHMASHDNCQEIVVASRSNIKNDPFFYQHNFKELYTTKVNSDFNYDSSRLELLETKDKVIPNDYDIIFLRLPRPTTDKFLKKLGSEFIAKCIINNPFGIINCSTKSVLLNFKNVCPPIKLCYTIKDVLSFSDQHDIVLKPLKEYGGKGIIRIKDGVLNDGRKDHSITEYLQTIEKKLAKEGYLAMKYLKNVKQGDKRLIVVGGEVLAASLRIPAENSWLCNVAMGGVSEKTEPNLKEIEIVRHIDPFLSKHGILIYGVDTLVDDEGHRTLSEINALSIGGFPQAEKQTGKPIIQLTLDKIFAYAAVHYNR
jgi:glutathione synthase